MQDTINQLAERIITLHNTAPSKNRTLVGIAGVPGAGKSAIAYPLVGRINSLLSSNLDPSSASSSTSTSTSIAVAVGLDGWHFSRAQLDAFQDPTEARRRRGAAFTFDAEGYVNFVRSLRRPSSSSSTANDVIPFPTFSHSLKDPLPSLHPILSSHQIIIIEGLYCLLKTLPWNQATQLLDERIWIKCEEEVARSRLVERHLQSGVETIRKEAEKRVNQSDMLNGEFIKANLFPPTITITTIEDPEIVAAQLLLNSKVPERGSAA